MSLVNLLNVPKNQSDWENFFWANRTQLINIQQAVLKQKSVNLPQYVVYPVADDSVQDFLTNNSQSHQDFNAVLGLQSSDLESVDLKDEKQLEAWVYLNYQELYTASQALNI